MDIDKINGVVEEDKEITEEAETDSQADTQIADDNATVKQAIRQNGKKKLVIRISDEDTIKKYNIIVSATKEKLKAIGITKESEINEVIIQRAISLLYASEDIINQIGIDGYQKLLEKKPFDILL